MTTRTKKPVVFSAAQLAEQQQADAFRRRRVALFHAMQDLQAMPMTEATCTIFEKHIAALQAELKGA